MLDSLYNWWFLILESTDVYTFRVLVKVDAKLAPIEINHNDVGRALFVDEGMEVVHSFVNDLAPADKAPKQIGNVKQLILNIPILDIFTHQLILQPLPQLLIHFAHILPLLSKGQTANQVVYLFDEFELPEEGLDYD